MLRRVLVAAAVVFLMATSGAAAKVPSGWVGTLVDDPLFADGFTHTATELARIHAARVSTIRLPFYGFQYQATEGAPPDLRRADLIVLSAAEHGLRVLPVIVGSPEWGRQHPSYVYSAPSAKGRAAYVQLCTALAKRYGPKGTLWSDYPYVKPVPIRQWQIWNEPNLPYYWLEKDRVSGYTRLLKAANTAIKAVDPAASTLLAGIPSGGPRFLDKLYAAGARGSFDAVAVHPFTFKVANVKLILQRYRRALDAHHDRTMPIVVSELAWPSSYKKIKSNPTFGFDVTEAEQARRVREAYLMLARNRVRLGISAVYWASWITYDRSKTVRFDYAGLRTVRNDRVFAKPAYAAFVKVIRQISGA